MCSGTKINPRGGGGRGGGGVSVTDINDDANVTIVGYYSTTQSFRSAIDNSMSKYEVIN